MKPHPGLPAARVAAMVFAAAFASLGVLQTGCGPSKPSDGPSAPAAPAPPAEAPAPPTAAMTLRVGSLDLSGFGGRVEKKHVDELAGLIAREKIDVLALQGLTRYPTVKTRTDLLDALCSITGMRQAFGQTITLSGRQSGNAVVSAYPIASSDARPYDGISGSRFEGALQAVVDAGTRPIVIVSTLVPEPLGARDAGICAAVLSRIEAERGRDPLVVLGTLPEPPAGDDWKTVPSDDAGRPRAWYTPGAISPRSESAARCDLGRIVLLDFDVYPQTVR